MGLENVHVTMSDNIQITNTSNVSPLDTYLLELLLDTNRSKEGWQTFLDNFRLHFNLHSCHIYISKSNLMAPIFQIASGPHPSEWQLKEYMEKYFETDYTHLAILKGKPHEWFASNLMPNRDEIESAPVFKQWSIPNGVTLVAGCCLFREDDWSCVFVHNRGPRHHEYTEEEVNRFRALSPFIEKAIKVTAQLNSVDGNQARLNAMCDQFRLPTAILNEQGCIVCMNKSMKDIANEVHLIHIKEDKHFHLEQTKQDKQLNMNIAQTIASAKGEDLSYDTSPISITINNQDHILGVSPISSINHEDSEAFYGAIIYIASVKNIQTVSTQNLRQLFNLTQSEARVCQLFSLGKNPKEIAVLEDKSVYTVQEQIKSSYRKTNTRGQLELISLLASLPAN